MIFELNPDAQVAIHKALDALEKETGKKANYIYMSAEGLMWLYSFMLDGLKYCGIPIIIDNKCPPKKMYVTHEKINENRPDVEKP